MNLEVSARVIPCLLLLSAVLLTNDMPSARGNFVEPVPPVWSKAAFCYGPDFPTYPEYNHTLQSLLNLTDHGVTVGEIQLGCGPRGFNQTSQVHGTLQEEGYEFGTTDIHWNESSSITPSTTNPSTNLTALLANMTKIMYVNDRAFANLSLSFTTLPRWNASLTCDPYAYSWAFSLTFAFTFAYQGSQVPPGGELSCTSLNPVPGGLTGELSADYDSFEIRMFLMARYSEEGQPVTLRSIADLNDEPIGREHVAYRPFFYETFCSTHPGSYIVPNPTGGALAIGLSIEPLFLFGGASEVFPGYLRILPNDPPHIQGHDFAIHIINTNIPNEVTFTFKGFSPLEPPGSTYAYLPSTYVDLTVSASGEVPAGLYTFTIHVDDSTTGKGIRTTAELLVCGSILTFGLLPILGGVSIALLLSMLSERWRKRTVNS